MSGRLATATLTALAMTAFAANSVLCRAALGAGAIDAASFALVRLGSGAAVLAALHHGAGRATRPRRGWAQPLWLAVYAVAFAFAYRSLAAGTGALILFGCVQATMLAAALLAGERFRVLEAAGLALALAGLASLVAPGLTAPAPLGAALMAAAGAAWGLYSLGGRGSSDPLGETQHNFLLAGAVAVAVAALAARSLHVTPRGAALAVVSGAVTSGLGYVAWFAALRGLTAIRAAVVQLAVPALAALGGVALLSERVTLRLVVSAALIFAGVGDALLRHARGLRPRRAGGAVG